MYLIKYIYAHIWQFFTRYLSILLISAGALVLMLDKIPKYLYVLYLNTVIYQLIAAATTTFSKQKVWLLSKGSYYIYEGNH